MSTSTGTTGTGNSGTETTGLHHIGFDEVRRGWSWLLALGIVLVLLGTAALIYTTAATIASVVFFGWLLIVGGTLQAGHAVWRRGWGGFFLELLSGLLYIVVGFLLVGNPWQGAESLTLLIAMLLLFGGVFRIVVGLTAGMHHRLWVILYGVINLMLGGLILKQWPLSGLWVIGLFLGIDMVFNGWTLIMLSLTARKLMAAKP
jgi:uncharacterized membrane protein HdeD (DUF308 family)